MMINKKQNELIEEIRVVLLKDWDPLCVGDNPNLKDEYDGYISLIVQELSKGGTSESIVRLLEQIEHEQMEINSLDKNVHNKVAQNLKQIGVRYFGKIDYGKTS